MNRLGKTYHPRRKPPDFSHGECQSYLMRTRYREKVEAKGYTKKDRRENKWRDYEWDWWIDKRPIGIICIEKI